MEQWHLRVYLTFKEITTEIYEKHTSGIPDAQVPISSPERGLGAEFKSIQPYLKNR